MPNLIEHLEGFLGPIEEGWKFDDEGISVVRFDGGPFADTVTFSTIGVSHHGMGVARSGNPIKQEFHIVVRSRFRERNLQSILTDVIEDVLKAHVPVLCGDVIGPRGPIVGTRMQALHAWMPVYFPDEFAICRDGTNEIVMVWLVPITVDEAAFVRSHGSEALEDLLIAENPDLTDLDRGQAAGIH